jgi:hypothetical protein
MHVVGFAQVEMADSSAAFVPPPGLAEFIAAGPPPVYIGFGSMVLPEARSRVWNPLVPAAYTTFFALRVCIAIDTLVKLQQLMAGLYSGKPLCVLQVGSVCITNVQLKG